jgi:hypothetical protein
MTLRKVVPIINRTADIDTLTKECKFITVLIFSIQDSVL